MRTTSPAELCLMQLSSARGTADETLGYVREYLQGAGRYALDQVVRSPFEERERERALSEIEACRKLLSTIEGIVRGDS